MIVDVFCPLYCAEKYIDGLLRGIKMQKDVSLGKVVFSVTRTGNEGDVLNRITAAGFSYFLVEKEEFSHSLTRERAMFEYCENNIVIMLSQDVALFDENSFATLAGIISEKTVYAYGKQICRKRLIEKYIREKNYGNISCIITAADIEKMQLGAFFSSDAFAAYYRPAFLELGGYDGIPMMMNEDVYYSKKVFDAGYAKAYCAEAVVEHYHQQTLKQLYRRYFETGKWFSEHSEFDCFKTTDSGIKLALYVLGKALGKFDLPVLFRWLPDMAARYLGMKKGKKLAKGAK